MYLGADPELWATKGGKIIPASEAGFPEGKYIEVNRIKAENNQMTAYRDGYAVELNYSTPHLCRGTMGSYTIAFIKQLQSRFGIKFSTLPAITVTEEEISSLPADVAMLGCSPSRNAYEKGKTSDEDPTEVMGGINEIGVEPGTFYPHRSLGGHLWISNTSMSFNRNLEAVVKTVKLFDYYVGLPLTALFERPEAFIRRKLYGKAGEFRTKTFPNNIKAIEYRVPSSEWLNNMGFMSLALGSIRLVAAFWDLFWHTTRPDKMEDELRAAINEGVGLQKLMENHPGLPGLFTGKSLLKAGESPKKFDFVMGSDGIVDGHSGWDGYRKTKGLSLESRSWATFS